jgi:hypothetical protein
MLGIIDHLFEIMVRVFFRLRNVTIVGFYNLVFT